MSCSVVLRLPRRTSVRVEGIEASNHRPALEPAMPSQHLEHHWRGASDVRRCGPAKRKAYGTVAGLAACLFYTTSEVERRNPSPQPSPPPMGRGRKHRTDLI